MNTVKQLLWLETIEIKHMLSLSHISNLASSVRKILHKVSKCQGHSFFSSVVCEKKI